MGVTVIRASEEHLNHLVPLFDGYRIFYKQESDIPGARAFLQARLKNRESVIFLALDDEGREAKGLGFVQLYPSFSSVSMAHLWILNDLFVAADCRRRGVGKSLMQAARDFAEQDNAKRLSLATATDNTSAQTLYESIGYQRDSFVRYNLELR